MAEGTNKRQPRNAAAAGVRKAGTLSSGATHRTTDSREASARKMPRTASATPRVASDRVAYLVDTFGKRQLAEMVGIHRAQLSRWVAGSDQPREAAGFLLDLEHALAKARLAFGEQAAKDWLLGNNSYLGGARPIDVLKANGSRTVMDALNGEQWGSSA